MSSIVNTTPAPNVNHPVDFAFYSASTLGVLQTQIGALNIPYGLSTLATNVTTPADTVTPFSISVADASTFVGGSGYNPAGSSVPAASFASVQGQYPIPVGFLYLFTSNTNWALIGYSFGPLGQAPITGNTFGYCFVIDGYNGGTSLTFNSSPTLNVYDPRWVTYLLPLSLTPTNVTFDAMDTLHLGLPNSKNANIISFYWDLGNGTQADGPVVETQYWYTGQLNYATGQLAAPSEIKVTLMAIDINGDVYHVSHPVVFSHLYNSLGAAFTPANMSAYAASVASGSNGVNVNTFAGAGVLNVNETTGFPSSGTIQVTTYTSTTVSPATFNGVAIITYTGKTSTTFTGCTTTTNGVTSGILTTGTAVLP